MLPHFIRLIFLSENRIINEHVFNLVKRHCHLITDSDHYDHYENGHYDMVIMSIVITIMVIMSMVITIMIMAIMLWSL